MICKMFRNANPVCLRKLFFTSAVICLGIFILACSQNSAKQGGINEAVDDEQGRIIEVVDAEHKTVKHPDKKYYVTIQADGLQVSFHTAQGHYGYYTFPHKAFTQGEPAFLLCPGSPDLLPMRAVLIRGANNDLNAYHDYRIEWLDESPAASGGAHIVRSY